MDAMMPDDIDASALMPDDMIAIIITAAPLSVIGAFARTCRQWAAFVDERANDIASARATTARTYMGLARYSSSVLSNGVKHGVISAEWAAQSHVRRKIAITYERGVAVMWTCDKLTVSHTTYTMALTRGHRDIMCFMRSDADMQYVDIVANYAKGIVLIDVAAGVIDAVSQLPDIDASMNIAPTLRNLTGYFVDGVLVPSVIKPWFDAVVASWPDKMAQLGAPKRFHLKVPAEIAEHFGEPDIIDLVVR